MTITLKELENRITLIKKQLKDEGMTNTQIKQMPIMLGDDDELNGIHENYYIQVVDETEEGWQDFYGNVRGAINNKFILFS